MNSRWSELLEALYQEARNNPNCVEMSDSELWEAIGLEVNEEE